MAQGNPHTVNEQTMAVPLPVGSRVELYEDVDIDEDEGAAASITFCGYVEQYSPETGLLSFEDSDVGYAEFVELMQEADGVEILSEYSDF